MGGMGNIMNMMKELEGMEKGGQLGDLTKALGGNKTKKKRR